MKITELEKVELVHPTAFFGHVITGLPSPSVKPDLLEFDPQTGFVNVVTRERMFQIPITNVKVIIPAKAKAEE